MREWPRRTVVAGFGAAGVSACATAMGVDEVAMTIVATVPAQTGRVFISGNLASLGPWNPAARIMEGQGAQRRITLRAPRGFVLEFKVTLGDWNREGLGPSGTVMPNSRAVFGVDAVASIVVTDFKKDPLVYLNDPAGSGVNGRLVNWLDVSTPRLDQTRHVQIWLPPSYDDAPQRRYRVIYMHDGQNLFDPRIANTGVDWGVDEAMARIAVAQAVDPAIVVAVWSTNQRRLEYAPSKVIAALPGPVRAELKHEFGGDVRGDAYIAFLADELKPRIDASFRTLSGPSATSLMGSSMGGLISFYGAVERPDVFSAAACLSMHWPVAIRAARIFEGANTWRLLLLEAYRDYLRQSGLSPARTRLWCDHGGQNLDTLYAPYQAAMQPVFEQLGFVSGPRLQLRAFPESDHNEASWRARLDEPLRFLLS